MLPPTTRPPIEYPESDGKRMAENTIQFRWIFILFGNLAALFAKRDDVWVGGDLLWYPVEGEPGINIAPDDFVIFGRPKGDRGSYKQWEEGGVPMTVVFEILSPSNTAEELTGKFDFYEQYGVEEYYIYDPDHNHLTIYVRRGEVLRRVRPVEGFVSPRLGIRFDLSGEEMVVYGPDNKRFLTFEELEELRQAAEKRAESAENRAESAEKRLARVIELNRKVRQGQASPEEIQELERLENG